MENKKQSLYDLTGLGQDLENKLEGAINWETGEITEDYEHIMELKNTINELIVNKGKDLIYVLRKKDNFLEEINNEIKRLNSIKKTYINQKENLVNYIISCMSANDIKTIETPIGKLSLRNNPPSVEIYDEKLVDKKFITEVVEYKISKTEIKKAIENGEEVQGAKLIQKVGLRVK